MRGIRVFVCLASIACVLTACSPEPVAQPEVPSHFYAARDFASALWSNNPEAALELTEPVTSETLAAEIAQIGPSPSSAQTEFVDSWDGETLTSTRGTTVFEVTSAQASAVSTVSQFATVVMTGKGIANRAVIGLNERGDAWVVETVDGYPAHHALVQRGEIAHECLVNMRLLQSAISYANNQSTYQADIVRSLDELVPRWLSEYPTCPSGGTYSMPGATSVQCSVHGMLQE